MYITSDFCKGLKIEYQNKPWVIVDFLHVNPGKGSAFVRTKLKNLETAQVLEVTFKSGEKVGKPDLDLFTMQFLYIEKDKWIFMNTDNYEQFVFSQEEIGEKKYFLNEDSIVKATFYNGKPVSIDVETFVEIKVKETQPSIKGNTASGGGKPATLLTGLILSVPFHIEEGDIIKIDTRTSRYIEKVK